VLDVLKRNALLLAVLGAVLLLFFTTTLPALQRKQALARMYRIERQELQLREAELQRLELLRDALLARDPAQLDRASQKRFVPPAPR
jgi:hypothetical protein